jgi:hypothetical protein
MRWESGGADAYNVQTWCNDVATVWQGERYPGGPIISETAASANTNFIAEARTGWPAALAEIERLRNVIRYVLADAERIEVETYLDRTYGEGWPSGYAEGKNDIAESIASFLRKEALQIAETAA